MNICTNCQHSITQSYPVKDEYEVQCVRPSVITGKPQDARSCVTERHSPELCGIVGRFYLADSTHAKNSP